MTELTLSDQQGDPNKITVVYTLEEIAAQHKNLRAYIRSQFEEGVHYTYYGKRTPNSKPALTKAGAEKICFWFAAKVDYEIVDKEINHFIEVPWVKEGDYGRRSEGVSYGLYRYTTRCLLRNGRGDFLGGGLGLCSTLEKKYIDRPRELENTVLKMSEKRALAGVVINVFALSDLYTQDLDDLSDNKEKEEDKKKNETRTILPTNRQPQPHQTITAPKEITGFNRYNKAHQDAFIKMMEEKKIDFDLWDAIGERFHGRPRADLEACIASVTGDHVRSIGGDDRSVAAEEGLS